MEKPKIQISNNNNNNTSSSSNNTSKNSESESDLECGLTSDIYYDVVETYDEARNNSYENVADGSAATVDSNVKTEKSSENVKVSTVDESTKKSSFFTSQTISDMFMSSSQNANSSVTAIKKRAESYNLMDNTFVSSKITCDGLIVTKNHLEDALDSTGSSFDSSSDEELSNGRSESDSGIGIKGTTSQLLSKDLNNSNNSSDYEDIQVTDEINKALANSRELPDGRSDNEGSAETSPAPVSKNVDPRQSFLHSTANKPKVPIKPVSVNVVKPFQKRNAEIIMQLQQVINNKEKSLSSDSLDVKASATNNKKSRAPEPPHGNENETQIIPKNLKEDTDEPLKSFKEFIHVKTKFSSKTNTVQIKEPRNYPAINPKFRSLNHLNKAHEAQEKLEKFEKLQNSPTTPEPAPRHSLSLSSDSLVDIEKGMKKKKFSIKKFLRMGSNSKTDHTPKKDYSHYADIPTSPSDDPFNAPQVKPRLIIIHPLDINNSGVEVVTTPTSPSSSSSSPLSTGLSTDKNQSTSGYKKPPVPPNRSDSTKLEMNKPTRPPPPKNSDIRTKLESEIVEQQKSVMMSMTTKTVINNDTVYANLGEIRNSIAPRKPERTNSMREREAKTLELQKRHVIGESIASNENDLTLIDNNNTNINNDSSHNKSEEDHTETYKNEDSIIAKAILKASSPIVNSTTDGNNKKKIPPEIENVSTRSKIELFENNALKNDTKPIMMMGKTSSPNVNKQTTFFVNSDGLKSSVQKMNMTIDSYLKNKKLISSSDSNLLDNSRSPTPPQQQIIANVSSPLPLINYNIHSNSAGNIRNSGLRNASYEPINVNVSAKYNRSSYPDNGMCSPVLTFGE